MYIHHAMGILYQMRDLRVGLWAELCPGDKLHPGAGSGSCPSPLYIGTVVS